MDAKTRTLLCALAAAEAELTRLHRARDRAMGGHNYDSMGHCLDCDAWSDACQRSYRAKDALSEHAAATAAQGETRTCYPVDVDTLREMLAEQRDAAILASKQIGSGKAVASAKWSLARADKRIEALTTAIEALGGAL